MLTLTLTVADLDEYGEEIVADVLSEADPGARLEDVGIGAYEYWGFSGRDTRIAAVAEPVPVTVRVAGLAERPDLAECLAQPVYVTYRSGGCDGDHSGRCRPCCAETEVTVAWRAAKRETRGSDVFVVFEGEQDNS